MDEIITQLKNYDSTMNNKIAQSFVDGYKEGFATGFKKAFEVANIEFEVANIDMNSIKVFSEWCYINGIDFSYMAKATDTVPFTERVMKKFKEEIDKIEGN